MTDQASQMLEQWADIPASQPLDVDKEMQDITFSIAGLTLFGVDLQDEVVLHVSGIGDHGLDAWPRVERLLLQLEAASRRQLADDGRRIVR